mmetsp:Transcript_29022/g.52865  ORF Transcript_29022/g.52865 Transcript_29022/m.52865 type:complete len:220 (-) Transcript_29022:129-788(-)
MWTSKLGQKYPLDWIKEQDAASQQRLKALRTNRSMHNDRCADCGKQDSSWASVSHGVFICVVCSDVHRSVGTHISKVKGCTGTYLWGPDELEKMAAGNLAAERLYGAEKVDPAASKEEKQRYVTQKYTRPLADVSTPPPAVMQQEDVAPPAKQAEMHDLLGDLFAEFDTDSTLQCSKRQEQPATLDNFFDDALAAAFKSPPLGASKQQNDADFFAAWNL